MLFIHDEKIFNNLKSGFLSGAINSIIFYPPKTIIKYQYVNGTPILNTFNILSKSKDYFRLFRGIIPNCFKYSLGRMGEAGIYTYYNDINNNTINIIDNSKLSGIIALWKINLMPLDTISNIYQINGTKGFNILKTKIKNYGFNTLYYGSYPHLLILYTHSFIWYGIFNKLENILVNNNLNSNLNYCVLGFTSSAVTDFIINPIKIVKVYKQTNNSKITYQQCLKELMKNNKYNFIYRGLGLKIIINGINSSLYVFLWKNIEKKFN